MIASGRISQSDYEWWCWLACDIHGLASTAYTLGTTAGTESIRADVAGLTGIAATFSLTSNAGAPIAVVPVSRGAQHITAGGSLAGPLVALVTDSHGNPVTGVTVAWRIVTNRYEVEANGLVAASLFTSILPVQPASLRLRHSQLAQHYDQQLQVEPNAQQNSDVMHAPVRRPSPQEE